MVSSRVKVDQESLAALCRRWRVQRLSFFGSAVRGDFGPDSDVDALVEFEPGAVVGLVTMAKIEAELTALVGRQVDLRTAADLSRYFRDEVLATAQVQYARG